MLKTILVPLVLPLLLLFGNGSDKSTARLKQISNGSDNSVARFKQETPDSQTGTLEKMMVAQGSATMDIDLNRLNGIGSRPQVSALRFTLAPNSFFTILVYNNVLRGPDPGSMALIPQSSASLPAALAQSFHQLIIEKAGWTEPFDIVVRDGKTGFTFFNIEGNLYDYDAKAQSLSIKEGRLLISEEFAATLGRPAEAGSIVGKISITATMRTIEITHVVNGESTSAELPPNGTGVPGPDVIVGGLPVLQQFGSSGTQVGLAVATDSCNAGAEPLNWFALPNNDHPVIPQNLYRMSGGATNDDRFEQIGQSSVKHAFTALQQDVCGFGCQSSGTGTRLGAGCSDPYSASLNAGPNLGSRAWINPFTGAYPRGDSATPPNNHSGHTHSGTSHRILVNTSDLNTTLNPGATYYAEAQYVTPHEYAWCQSNPGQCNMYNNASYRRFNVSGTTSFSFSGVGSTVQTKPAVVAWNGATHNTLEPAPGVDGLATVSYKVTNPSPGVWHYEYVVYNQNLDRGIQSFSVPLAPGITISNIGFHAPPQHPGSANDGTVGSAGYSSTPWTPTQTADALTWTSETFAQNQNANAIRWGTMYNFRFDSDQPPQTTNATVGFFKTGTPMPVQIQGPSGAAPTPTPTPTPGGGGASFVTTDTTTQGNWNGTYGADGYNIIGDTVNYPAYAQVNPSNNLAWTWAASTTDVRALRRASLADRIAATWYSATSFTINLNLTDAQTHRVALYCVDFDSQGRSQTVEIRDGASNTLLDSRSLTAFTGGRYLVWDVTGNVNIVVTRNAGANGVVSGLFFGAGGGPTPTPTPGVAAFITTDTTTQGNWNGTYGADGYNIIGDTVNYPAYAQVNSSNNQFWTWAASTSDVRALRKASLVDRIAATWYSATSFTINLNLTDGQTHRVALYCVDFDSAGRSQTVEIRDGTSNTLLDSRSLSAFAGGQYLVWSMRGNVKIVVTGTAGPNGVVSGLFFQPAPPPAFSDRPVAGGIANPTAMAFAPDGRLFVCQQTGQLRVIKNGALLTDPFLTVPVNSSGERGLLGIAFDPNFTSNHFVYIYYTTSVEPIHNRVSRFTANGDVVVPLSEQIIVDLDNLSGATNHNGGAIHFGPDNKLYIAVGENANPSNAETLSNRLGKMLRINSDGSIPMDNPFFLTAIGDNRSIWALGLRNPYTFAFQPGTGRMLINDVGQVSWEEINDGIAGSDYGWNTCEGDCVPPNASFRDPLLQYGHGIGPTTGCAITGGAFYNPTGVTYPSDYVGKYFYADFCSGWIRRFDPVTLDTADFRTGLGSPVDLKVGPDGNLYYLVRGGGGAVFKILYI